MGELLRGNLSSPNRGCEVKDREAIEEFALRAAGNDIVRGIPCFSL
jgi:hypothetical protein